MEALVSKNKRFRFAAGVRPQGGFTLIEVMVTLMILAFGMLASMVGIMAALDHNLMNEMRNDAMKLAQEQLEAIRNTNWGSGNMPTVNPYQIQIPVRKTTVNYGVNVSTPAVANPQNGQYNGLTIYQCQVTWSHKGPMDSAPRNYKYILQTIVRQTK